MTGYIPTLPPAERRMPMPPRICPGFERVCTTPLSIYNHDSLCGVCARKRSDAIATRGISIPAGLPTHCRHGHEYTQANTYWARRGRVCRECGRLRELERRTVETW